ncbi:MAG TPA: DNA ligase, partial [Candidatus Binatia bacterium]
MSNSARPLLIVILLWVGLAYLPQNGSAAGANASPALLLANELRPEISPINYLVSEKYDGVRAIWDGKTLRFRSGRTVGAPQWFIAKLPGEP